ncbi:MAG: hypothetical protein ACO2PO_20790 [Candidatus Calescibacterium sp.]|jgi:hypothetical protein
MLLILIFGLISQVRDGNLEMRYKCTISTNLFSIVFLEAEHGVLPLPSPGINFELRISRKFSFNFELNNVLFIFPHEVEIGVREYLGREGFKSFYIYQGLAIGLPISYRPDRSFIPTDPSLVLIAGYKSIGSSGFTIDPFLGAKIFYAMEEKRIIPTPALGLYLGYSW